MFVSGGVAGTDAYVSRVRLSLLRWSPGVLDRYRAHTGRTGSGRVWSGTGGGREGATRTGLISAHATDSGTSTRTPAGELSALCVCFNVPDESQAPFVSAVMSARERLFLKK